jgi:CDP-paratose 2-epimerase
MSVAIVTGSAGLIGSEAVRFLAAKGLDVVGIDNDMRGYFFGPGASTEPSRRALQSAIPSYRHESADIRDLEALRKIFERFGGKIALVVHTAAQPSHDWAAREPFTDFGVNATGTLNMLEVTRQYCPDAVFLFTSTNKVYGDAPNFMPLVEAETRYTLPDEHPYAAFGIDESMSIDQSMHSLFGASKVAADVLVQEYGRYFGLKCAIFRGGCLTGPGHAGAPLHGFLAYLVKCAVQDQPYTVLGYKGKQVRDNIHSHDLVSAFWEVFQNPPTGEVYNVGGGVMSNCSMVEAISRIEAILGRPMRWSYAADNRKGDHIWWISDTRKLASHFPGWKQQYDIGRILEEMVESERHRARAAG